MINLLIEPNDEFVVEFAVAKDKNGRIYSDTNLVDLKEMLSTVGIECEIEEHSATFKKPNFKDVVDMAEAFYGSTGGRISINLIQDKYKKVTKLIKSWTFKDLSGNEIKPTQENINKLEPIVAQVIADKVDIETGGTLSGF